MGEIPRAAANYSSDIPFGLYYNQIAFQIDIEIRIALFRSIVCNKIRWALL